MSSPQRIALSLAALAASALLIAGCTSTPGAPAPTSTGSTDKSDSADDNGNDDFDDIEAAWLDDGRAFALVTWGSSTCVPMVDEITADGQNVSLTLVDAPADKACTADMSPRASFGGLPEGVDPTKDVTLTVKYGDVTDDVELDGSASLTGTPGTSTEFQPSAGWFDDSSLVLLTWGSSTCAPVVEGVEGSGSAGTVTFKTDEAAACTMDMAPRLTIVAFDGDVDDDTFELTLVGGNLDGTLTVLGS